MSEIHSTLHWLERQVAWDGESFTEQRLQCLLHWRQRAMKNPTPAEARFCRLFTGLVNSRSNSPLRFKQQFMLPVSTDICFFADFYFKSWKLVVEVDGPHHKRGATKQRDTWRTLLINQHGTTVMRLTNREVMEQPVHVVHQVLMRMLQSRGHANLKRTLLKQLRQLKQSRPALYSWLIAPNSNLITLAQSRLT